MQTRSTLHRQRNIHIEHIHLGFITRKSTRCPGVTGFKDEIMCVFVFRMRVISALSHLKKMDFSAVTREERVLANVWNRTTEHRQKHRREFPVTVTSSSSH